MQKVVVGIDLGTTNSAIAVLRGKDVKVPQTITLEDGSRTLPSCVMYDKGKIIVGKTAYKSRWNTDKVVYSVKRRMGTNDHIHINDGISEFDVTPQQVSSEILKELVRQAELVYGGGNITEATITVPAYFNNNQRRATMEAAELAGLKVLKIINEPTSAALAYGLDTVKDNERILVFDLGGGTFDVTLLEISTNKGENFDILGLSDDVSTGKTVTILSNGGDTHLGGDDFDYWVYEAAWCRLIDRSKKEFGYSSEIVIAPEDREYAILQIELWKKFNIKAHMTIPMPITVDGDKKTVQMDVNPEDGVGAFEYIYDRCSKGVTECLSTSPHQEFDRIVLVGGSTKMQMIKDRLHEEFPNAEIYDRLNPDESVACGAAVQSGLIYGDDNLAVNDVIPLPLGIEVNEEIGSVTIPDRLEVIIKKDTPIPCSNYKTVTTMKDYQDSIVLPVYQGLSRTASENTYIGSIKMDGLPKKKAEEVSISVCLSVDLNGMLKISANFDGKICQAELENILKSELVEPKKQLTLPLKKLKRAMDIAKRQSVVISEEVQSLIESAFISGKVSEPVSEWVKSMQELGKQISQAKINADSKERDEEAKADKEFEETEEF